MKKVYVIEKFRKKCEKQSCKIFWLKAMGKTYEKSHI